MTDVIQLNEFQETRCELSPSEVVFISTELRNKIAIQRAISGNEYRLNPQQYVGIVTLPTGRRIESHPKVPVRTLFVMLAAAYDLRSPFRDEAAQLDRLDELFEFVANHFADLVEQLIEGGLFRHYVEEEANLTTVRGRIAIAEDVRRNAILRHRTYCRFTEFTWDIPENQIIRQVAWLLSAWGFRPELRWRLLRLDAALAEIRSVPFSARDIDDFHYHRLNDHYRPVHALCRLFLEASSLSEEAGTIDFRSFLIDMNQLFERFVTVILQERAPVGMTVQGQASAHLDYGKRVPMRIDLLITQEGRPVAVADCKYKRVEDARARRSDVYQVLAYSVSQDVSTGLLIYPALSEAALTTVNVVNVSVTVRPLTIDLYQSGSTLMAECDRFAAELFSTIGHTSAPLTAIA